MASRHASDSTSSKCTSRDTVSSMKESNQQPVTEQEGPAASFHSKGLNSVKTSGVAVVVDTEVPQQPKFSSTATPNISRSNLQNHSLKPMNKVLELATNSQSAGIVKGRGYPMREYSSFSSLGQQVSPNNGPSNFQSAGPVKGGYSFFMREHSSFSNQGQQVFPNNGPMGNTSNHLTRDGNDRFKYREKVQRNGDLNPCCETNRGPRARGGPTSLSSPAKNDLLGLTLVRRDKYNLPDFETKYENAKFYVIKSFNEDDIQKSIKYNVWASSPYGNKKLNAAFHDAESISSKTGKRCPIFLFFSVNGSGQFVGLAEMTGPVDFEKDMDFWQQNKWPGFLPIIWHIIKDIPNNQFLRILNEKNENKPVTHSRDTQEIGFKQGSEMLTIFKSFSAKTILLDDYDFYENQEKLPPDRSSKAEFSRTMAYGDAFLEKLPPDRCSKAEFSRTYGDAFLEKSPPNRSSKPEFPQTMACGDGLLEKLPPNRSSKPEFPRTMAYGDASLASSPLMLHDLAPIPPTKATSDLAPIPPTKATSDPASSRFATGDGDVHLCHAHSYDNYKADAVQKRGVFNEGDMVMVYQKRQMDKPHKLQLRRIGPFPILKRVNDKAYKVDLPPNYRNNTFNVANLALYTGNIIPPVRLPMAPHRPPTASDRIAIALMKDTVVTSRRTYSMFLVKLKNKDTWLSEKSFQQMDPEFYERYMAAIDQEQACQTRENNAKTQTVLGHEPEASHHGSGETHVPVET